MVSEPAGPAPAVGPAPSLGDILGQPRAIGVLQSAIASKRIHHAWIFVGPSGVGKRTTAHAFAAAILDPTTAPDLAGFYAPDPASATQRLIAEGAHPDLRLITKELARFSSNKRIRDQKLTTIAKDVVDERLLKPIALAPVLRNGGLASKVFIVDEAELLDRSRFHAPTQNSMLKTLEEPPAGAVLILVTSAEEMLLPTIRSRCQRIVFDPLDEASMSRWLDRSGSELSAEQRAWVLEFAQGSPGRALAAIAGGMFEWSRVLEPMLAHAERGRFSTELGSTMAKLIEDWAKNWVEEHANASKEAANHAGARHVLGLVAHRVWRRLRSAADADDRDGAEHALADLACIERAEAHMLSHVSIASAMEGLAAGLVSAPRGDGAL